jgi:amino acid transporter
MDAQTGQNSTTAAKLHRQLSPFGVLLLTLSSLSPVFSVYGVGSQVLQQAGTGAAWLFLLGLLAAVIWAVVYAELGSAFPYAGGDYVGVGTILGGWAGAMTLGIWAVCAGPANAFEAQVIAGYAGALLPGMPAAIITFGTLAAAIIIALLAVRTGALITGLFLALEMIALLALIGAGFWHPARGAGAVFLHPVTLAAGGGLAPLTPGVFAIAFVATVFGVVGGNQALYFGEELHDPHRNMGKVVIMACLTGAMLTALPVIAVAFGVRDLAGILASAAPFTAFIGQKLGPAAGTALSAGVALAIFNAMIAQIMGFSRLYYSFGRDRFLAGPVNRWLAQVKAPSGVPRFATLVVGIVSAGCCLLPTRTLLIFLTGLLVYGWGLVCLAVLIGRRRGLTGGPGYWRSPCFPLAPILGLGLAVMFTGADLADPTAGRPSLILLGLAALASVLWYFLVLRRRPGGWSPAVKNVDD